MNEVKTGSIIVAHPDLEDPDFGRSVILLLRHQEHGAFGVNVAVKPVEGTTIHESGPLPLPMPIRLRKHDEKSTTSEVIPGTGYSFCAVHSIDEAMNAEAGGIVLTGYAGWKHGQLDQEMAAGAWFVTTATLEAILAVPPEQRWKVAATGAGIVVDE